jgi:hypothetical protein
MRMTDLPDTKAPPSLASEEQEKRELRRLIAAIRGTWRIPSLAATLLLILGFAGLGVLRAVLPASTTFILQFHFTFPTAETGRYPNGVPFSINAILDPAILDVVYEQLEIEKYGIERERFYGGFSIRPFATTGLETAERFRQQLLDRRLSFAERERVEQQLRNQLEVASRGAAELSFLVRSRVALPVEVGRAIVQKVPFEWARRLIEKKGVLRTAGFSGVDNVIPLAAIEQLPLPLRIVAVLQASRLLDSRIGDLSSTPGVLTVRDAVTGKSIRDIGRDIRDLELYRLNPLRATLVGSRFDDGGITLAQVIEQRIRDIDLAIADATAQAAAVGDMLSEYVQASTGLKGMAVEKRGLGPPAASADAVPQVGDSFIDRIITLTRRDRDIDQAQEALLSTRVLAQLDLNGSAIALRGEQSRWKELLADARADRADRKELDEPARARIVEAIGQAGNEANAMWAAISRIEKEFAANRTGRTAEIYASYAPRSDVIAGDGIPAGTAAVAVFSAAVIFWIVFWGFRALALLYRKQSAILPRG